MNPLLARRWRLATLASVAMLMIVVITWQLTPTADVEHVVLSLVFCIPMVAPIAGLWRGKRYTYRWATFCVIPYFVIGLTEVIADARAKTWATAMLAMALAWFITLIGYLRVTDQRADA